MAMLAQEKFEELGQFIDSLPSKEGELIRVLHKAQEIFGYLPKEVQYFVGRKLGVPTSKVYGVVTFYSYFTMNPKGENHISVCLGTACYVRGAEPVLDEFRKLLDIKGSETTPDGKFSLCSLRCIGACGLAPVVTIGDKVYGRVTKDMVEDILKEFN